VLTAGGKRIRSPSGILLSEISGGEIGPGERLCPACITRRLAPGVHDRLPAPLREAFQRLLTDEMFFKGEPGGYIAVLSMDGDRMGRLNDGGDGKFCPVEGGASFLS